MTRVSPARINALQILRLSRERNAYVRELLYSARNRKSWSNLSPSDRAFATRLVLGTCACRGTLDEALDACLDKPSNVSAQVRDILRLAAFEVLYLKKEPRVVISQATELTKRVAKAASGLVHASLHTLCARADAFLSEDPARAFGLPPWLYEQLKTDIGPERLCRFGASCLEPAELFLAGVPMRLPDKDVIARCEHAGFEVQACPEVPGAWHALNPSRALKSDLIQEELMLVSDLGAQLSTYLGRPCKDGMYLEVGAGRGTKTILAAGHAFREGISADIKAVELHASRAEIARRRVEETGISNIEFICSDICAPAIQEQLPACSFESVFVDAPCSGTGTLRRHPEITWSLTREKVDALAELQLRMLQASAVFVRTAGKLTYATCSVLRRENEDVVQAFLESPQGKAFEVIPAPDLLKPLRSDTSKPEWYATDLWGFMRTYPSLGSCDGHFCACLRRRPE